MTILYIIKDRVQTTRLAHCYTATEINEFKRLLLCIRPKCSHEGGTQVAFGRLLIFPDIFSFLSVVVIWLCAVCVCQEERSLSCRQLLHSTCFQMSNGGKNPTQNSLFIFFVVKFETGRYNLAHHNRCLHMRHICHPLLLSTHRLLRSVS